MKLKRLISLLLASVYLFAVGGPAVAALSCECIWHKYAAHACCDHCERDCGVVPGSALQGNCCGDHHSTEVELYTRVSSDDEENTEITVLDLPASLAAECPCPAHVPSLREKTAERRAPFIRDAYIPGAGFRAPPVLA